MSFRNGKLIPDGSYIAILPGVHPRMIRAIEENAQDGLSDIGTLQHDLLYFANVALTELLISQDNGRHSAGCQREQRSSAKQYAHHGPNESKLSDRLLSARVVWAETV